MDNVIRKLAGIFAGLAVFGIPANAQLGSQTTTFSGTIPLSCNASGNQNANLVLTQLDNFEGNSNSITFNSNGAVKLQLDTVNIIAAPAGTTNYIWTATLKNSGNNVIASADSASGSSPVTFANGLTNQNSFTVGLSVQNSTGNLIPGLYTAEVTIDCISNNVTPPPGPQAPPADIGLFFGGSRSIG